MNRAKGSEWEQNGQIVIPQVSENALGKISGSPNLNLTLQGN